MQPAGYFVRKRADNASRGYSVDYKYLAIAFATELAIVGTSLYGGWLFARIYSTDSQTFAMMMLAPIAYAGVELARVPLAFAWRVQSSKFWKIVFAMMVLCAAGVTVKSLSQLGEIMFRPRLRAVTEATIALRDARNDQRTTGASLAQADAVVEQRRDTLKTTEERLRLANTALAGLPKDSCWTVTRQTEQGTTRSRQCRVDGRQAPLIEGLKEAQSARDDAAKQLDAANVVRAGLSPKVSDAKVSALEVVQREAVMNSQLHSFTGMFFGKDPTEVNDGEIHAFLRWFVFFPAIFASLAATALALASVNYAKPAVNAVEIDEVALRNYVLEPLVEEVAKRLLHDSEVERAHAAAAHAARAGTPVETAGSPPPSINDNPRLKVVGDAP